MSDIEDGVPAKILRDIFLEKCSYWLVAMLKSSSLFVQGRKNLLFLWRFTLGVPSTLLHIWRSCHPVLWTDLSIAESDWPLESWSYTSPVLHPLPFSFPFPHHSHNPILSPPSPPHSPIKRLCVMVMFWQEIRIKTHCSKQIFIAWRATSYFVKGIAVVWGPNWKHHRHTCSASSDNFILVKDQAKTSKGCFPNVNKHSWKK